MRPRSRRGRLRPLLRDLLELLLPAACARCGADVGEGRVLCMRCDAVFPRCPAAACALCGGPVVPGPAPRCPGCTASPAALGSCVAAVAFEGEVQPWMHRFKYPRRGLFGRDVRAEAVVAAWAREAASRAPAPRPDAVVPVPLHPSRLRARGFNPAALLAGEIASALQLPFHPVALQRLRDTPSQTGLDRAARRRNVAGAFRARALGAARVWLVDDVVTTGATLQEAARALRRAGAAFVVGVCAARTPALR